MIPFGYGFVQRGVKSSFTISLIINKLIFRRRKMANDHRDSITFLKTPYGFLTVYGGFTERLNDPDIFILPSAPAGSSATKVEKIKHFLEIAKVPPHLKEELCRRKDECLIYAYECSEGIIACILRECRLKNTCLFWNGNRGKLKFYRQN